MNQNRKKIVRITITKWRIRIIFIILFRYKTLSFDVVNNSGIMLKFILCRALDCTKCNVWNQKKVIKLSININISVKLNNRTAIIVCNILKTNGRFYFKIIIRNKWAKVLNEENKKKILSILFKIETSKESHFKETKQ